jgi:hypothetical protein
MTAPPADPRVRAAAEALARALAAALLRELRAAAGDTDTPGGEKRRAG